MDKQSPQNTEQITDIPHSGKLPGEMNDLPHKESDISLKEAYALKDEEGRFVIQTPESAAELVTTEKAKPTLRNKFIAGLAGAALLITGGAVGYNAMKQQTPEDGPLTTSSSEPNPEATEVSIPSEAKDFVDAYGTRYTDPVATYYAEVAYETESGGDSFTIGDEYISNYNFESTVAGEKSPLGFDLLRLPSDATIDVPASVDQFNTSLPTMNRLINLLAKNPTPDAVAVIADEFALYSGYGSEDSAINLVTFFNGIISKYGSNSNYTINVASSEPTDSSQVTVFNPDWAPIIDGNREDGGVEAFHNPISLSISVDTYDSANAVTSNIDTTDNFNFTVNRAPESMDPLHGGFIAIGTQQ